MVSQMTDDPTVDGLRRDRKYAESRKRLQDVQRELECVADDVETDMYAHSARALAKRAELLVGDLERADFEGGGRHVDRDAWPWQSAGEIVRGETRVE